MPSYSWRHSERAKSWYARTIAFKLFSKEPLDSRNVWSGKPMVRHVLFFFFRTRTLHKTGCYSDYHEIHMRVFCGPCVNCAVAYSEIARLIESVVLLCQKKKINTIRQQLICPICTCLHVSVPIPFCIYPDSHERDKGELYLLCDYDVTSP